MHPEYERRMRPSENAPDARTAANFRRPTPDGLTRGFLMEMAALNCRAAVREGGGGESVLEVGGLVVGGWHPLACGLGCQRGR